MKSAGSWKELKFLLVLHDRLKLVANQCLSIGLQSCSLIFVTRIKESSSFSQRKVLSFCLSNVRLLGVGIITEFTAGIFPSILS